MREYSEYKDSHIRWIGEVPKHWEVKRLKNSTILNPSFSAQITPETIVAYMPMECLRNGVIQERVAPYKDVAAYTPFQDDDIVMAKVTPCFENGNIAVAKNLQSGYGFGTSEIFVIRCKKDTNNQYVFYYLQSDYIKNLGISSMTGTGGLKRVNPYVLNNSVLLSPPKTEQQHIVSFLDEKTAKIDEYIDKKNKEIEALKEWKKALIAHVVTKGLDTNAKMKDSGVSWIGEIPEHWKVKRLGSAFVENRTLNSSLEITEAYKFNYGALIRKDEDINPIEMMDTYCKYTCLNVNDIVINGLNLNYDFVSQRVAKAYAKGIITSAYLTLTPREGINPNYYLYLLKSMDSMKLFHGMGTGIRLTLSYNEIKKQQILFPPLVEQQEIVEYIDAATTKADKMIVELTNHVESMKEYKQRLIADVVTGKINVQP